MKRHGNLWPLITSEDNIRRAYIKAKRHKSKHNGVKKFKENVDENLKLIRDILIYKTFRTGSYYEKIIYEPKKRTVYVLPFHPDRIVHHAPMNVVIPIWEPMFIRDSYACIDDGVGGSGMREGKRKYSSFNDLKRVIRVDIEPYVSYYIVYINCIRIN